MTAAHRSATSMAQCRMGTKKVILPTMEFNPNLCSSGLHRARKVMDLNARTHCAAKELILNSLWLET